MLAEKKKHPSFTHSYAGLTWTDAVGSKYQYFCINCNKGPLFTRGNLTSCPYCATELEILFVDGDVIVKKVL